MGTTPSPGAASWIYSRAPAPRPLPSHGVRAWESHHARDFRMAPERHDHLEMFYILDGSGAFVLDGRRLPCRAGEVLVAPPGAFHNFEDKVPITLYGIEVAGDLVARDPAAAERLRVGRPVSAPGVADQMRAGLRRLMFEQAADKLGGRAMAVGVALQLVAVVANATPAAPGPPADDPDSAVARFAADLARRFYEPLGLDKAATELGMSRRNFTRLFRRATGASFADYLERVRVAHACRLLRGSSASVATVAFEAGFDDLSSFYRAFRKRVGSPPQQWRADPGGAWPDLPIDFGPARQDSGQNPG